MTKSTQAIAAELNKQTRQQKEFLSNLLKVVDGLDRAYEHWQKAEHECEQEAKSKAKSADLSKGKSQQSFSWPEKFWQSLLKILTKKSLTENVTPRRNSASTEEIVRSAREGVEMIRLELLDVLKKHSVTPIKTMGEPFTPDYMYAIGRKENKESPENTVLEEVVPGYVWGEKLLREAQVIVAVKPKDQSDQKN